MVGHDDALPARAVIAVPGLRILDIEQEGDHRFVAEDASVLDLFMPAVADVIANDVLPQVLANHVWSGELSCRTKTGSTTAVTPPMYGSIREMRGLPSTVRASPAACPGTGMTTPASAAPGLSAVRA